MVGLVPTPADRADYYPEPYGVRSLSWSNTGSTIGAASMLDLQAVADWSTLLIRNVNTGAPANAGVWTVSWWADGAGTLLIGTDVLVLAAGVPFDIALAVKGPYVSIAAASITGAGSYPGGGWIGVSSYPAQSYLQAPVRLVDIPGGTIAAGASLTLPATITRPGPASISVACGTAVTWDLGVTFTDANNVTHDAWRWLFTTSFGNVQHNLFLPAVPVSMRIHNSDATARAFAGSLISGVG